MRRFGIVLNKAIGLSRNTEWLLDRRISVAPMMDWTDRWCRAFHRLLTKRALLFTEMVVDQAVIHGDRQRLLGWDPAAEGAVALQLGGSDPAKLAEAARIGEALGYCEINLNVGCPSDRVQDGRFGACLMREPDLVADCVAAMRSAVATPVTVKSRIGVDDQDPETALFDFVERVAAAGCTVFYVHARKAWLKGLSPKENRDVPPLDYALVRRLKQARPELAVILNGGLRDLDHALEETAALDGAMLGRAAYHTPFEALAGADARVYCETAPAVSREEVVEGLIGIAARATSQGRSVHAVARHALGLFHAQPGARTWRRVLTEQAQRPQSGPDVFRRARDAMRAERRGVA